MAVEAVLAKADALVHALGQLELGALEQAELHRLTVGIQAARSRLGGAAAAALAAWDARRVWANDGSRSPSHRLARDTRAAVDSARREVRRARQLREMPLVAEAVVDGRLSLDHADLLARARQPHRREVFSEHEAVLVEQCRAVDFRGAVKVVQRWVTHVDALVDAAPRPDEPERWLHASRGLEGTLVLNGTLDKVGGAIVERELCRLTKALRTEDQRLGRDRTPAARRAAALVEMARRSTSAPLAGQPAQPLFIALVGDDSVRTLCELANGVVVGPADLLPFADDALLESVLFDGPKTVVAVSRQRSFRGALRRAVEVRDRHCQHPSGCDVPMDECDVDHIVPVARGGPTSQFNGRLECTTHNRRPDFHDHHATPLPARHLDGWDVLKVKYRWRSRHEDADRSGEAA